jgi:hypothetical protein
MSARPPTVLKPVESRQGNLEKRWRAYADASDVAEQSWPASLRTAGFITCAGATVGIALQAGANHPLELVAVVAASLAFVAAFYVITQMPGLRRGIVLH